MKTANRPAAARPGLAARLRRALGRIRVRLLAVNLLVVLIPAAGLEFARVYEHQLLDSLERDMENQAVLLRTLVEDALAAGTPLANDALERLVRRAARQTRTRVRLVTPSEGVVVDSHRLGPPEGREAPPKMLGRSLGAETARDGYVAEREPETPIHQRVELRSAFAGSRSTRTRVASNPPAVFLFLAEPIRHENGVKGAIYVTRSTTPVLMELYRIRSGLIVVLVVAAFVSALMTLGLAWTISRPLERLVQAARRIAKGDMAVAVPHGGGGELGELSEAFAEMTRKLEARQRYISEFAADVAHAFKSPLTSIHGAAELLAEGAADDPEARRRFLRNIELDAERLDRLVSRLLELSRIDASDSIKSAIVLEDLLRRAVDRAQDPTGSIVLDYRAEIPVIRGRAAELEIALLNLLDNALRFSPAGERVEVLVNGKDGDAEVKISVSDVGPGILPEHQPRLFERFFTTEADGEGTGLGLAIVKSVVDAHAGSIEVESVPGNTTFRISLPVGFEPKQRGKRRPTSKR